MYKKFDELIKTHNTTIYKVAKETGIPSTALYEWKSGKCQPKLDKLQKIAEYFGVTIEYFLNTERS